MRDEITPELGCSAPLISRITWTCRRHFGPYAKVLTAIESRK